MRKLLLIPVSAFVISSHAQTNYALSFSPAGNSYINVSDNSSLLLADNFTLEAWVYLQNSANETIIDKGDHGFLFQVFPNSNTGLGLYNPATNWIYSAGTVPQNQWVHVAVTFSNSTNGVKFYLNGVLLSQHTPVAALTTTAGPVNIGRQSPSTCSCNNFQSTMDELRIWNTVRSQAQLKQYMFKPPDIGASGLVAYYKFNEGSSITVTNSCTNTTGIDGTFVNSLTWTASPVQFAANALNFDGSDDYVVIPHVVSSDFTVEFWMNTTTTASGGTQWYNGNGIVDAEVGGVTDDWGTAIVNNKLAFGVGSLGGSDVTLISSSVINTGNWVHVAASWKQSNGEMKLYINGNPEGTTTGSTHLRNVPRITLGELQTNIQRYNGSIDEVRIWNEVRSQAQVQANMNNELNPSAQTNLAAYYTFNQGIASGTNSGLNTLMDQKSTNNGTLTNFSLSGSSSNYIAQKSGLFVLPSQWLSFTAQIQDNKVMLNWSTANEQNTKDFIIQHGSNGTDWNDIAVVAATGNSNTISNYSYLHSTPVKSMNFYRIRQRDIDGRSSYSDIRSVKFITEKFPFTILENPVINGALQVQVNSAATLSLYNNNGKLLWQKQVNPGTQTIDVSGYAKGIYLLKTIAQSKKVLVQ